MQMTFKHKRSQKGLFNPISIAGGLNNPLVEVEYKGSRVRATSISRCIKNLSSQTVDYLVIATEIISSR